MRTLVLLLLAFVTHGVCASDLPVRIQYDENTAPNGVIFKSLVTMYMRESDDLSVDPVDLLWSQLNIYQLPNGSWTHPKEPKFSREKAVELLNYLSRIKQQAEARKKEMWRVLACPGDRARPSGDDVYLVVEVLQDAGDSLWEQLRQQAIAEYGQVIAQLTDKHRDSMGMGSRRYHMKKMWAMSGRDDPDGLLDEWCHGNGFPNYHFC